MIQALSIQKGTLMPIPETSEPRTEGTRRRVGLTGLAVLGLAVGALALWAQPYPLSPGFRRVSAQQAESQGKSVSELEDGEKIYEATCAACHGSDGSGRSAEQLGLDAAPADFTDCSFASREGTKEWLAVAHEGGPTRGFSQDMPAFGNALSEEQLRAAIGHIRTFCEDKSWPRGEFNLPRPLVTTKAFPEDEVVLATSVDTEDPGSAVVDAIFEKRIGSRNQVEMAIPFGWKETTGSGGGGTGQWRSVLGDITLGFKRVVFDDLDKGSIVSLNAEAVLPTGDERTGFSKDTVFLEPQVLFGQLLPADFFVQGQGGFGLPVDTDETDEEAFWRLTGGRSFHQGGWGRRWTPMVELLGSRDFVDGADVNWAVVPQLQATLNKRQHVRFNVGAEIPVNNTGPRETRVMAYLLWDWFDGGLFQGW